MNLKEKVDELGQESRLLDWSSLWEVGSDDVSIYKSWKIGGYVRGRNLGEFLSDLANNS